MRAGFHAAPPQNGGGFLVLSPHSGAVGLRVEQGATSVAFGKVETATETVLSM